MSINRVTIAGLLMGTLLLAACTSGASQVAPPSAATSQAATASPQAPDWRLTTPGSHLVPADPEYSKAMDKAVTAYLQAMASGDVRAAAKVYDGEFSLNRMPQDELARLRGAAFGRRTALGGFSVRAVTGEAYVDDGHRLEPAPSGYAGMWVATATVGFQQSGHDTTLSIRVVGKTRPAGPMVFDARAIDPAR